MPLLTITNLQTSPLTIQDPTGLTGLSLTVPGSGAITNRAVSEDALASIEALLIAETTAGNITWTASDDPNSTADSVPEHIQTVLVTPYNAVPGDQDIVTNLTTPGAVSVVLPVAAKVGARVHVVDGKGDAATNNVTITVASGGTINGGANIVLSTNKQAAILLKIGATTWVGHRVTV
jgi:hypothetical protein